MSSLRLKTRELRRIHFANKYKIIRKELTKIIRSPIANLKEKEIAQRKIQKLPKDSNIIRISNRCKITGRSRGVYRFVGLCRNMFKYYAMRGDIPGMRKSSW